MDLKCGYLTLLFDQGSEVSCQCRDTSGSDKTLANGRSFPIMLQLQQRRDLILQVTSNKSSINYVKPHTIAKYFSLTVKK